MRMMSLLCRAALPVTALIFAGAFGGAARADLLDQGYSAMYNLNFDAAHRSFAAWEQAHPDDPMGPVSDAAAYLFFEFDRMNILRSEFLTDDKKLLGGKRVQADAKTKQAFEMDLQKSQKLSAAMLARGQETEKARLADVIRTALHANYEALIEKHQWQALNEIKQARIEADALVAQYPASVDAYLAMGVENYLLSQKAAPLRIFLRMTGAQTDKEAGLAKLRIVAERGHYLKPYAKILLAIAALRDGNKAEAKSLLSELAAQFPANGLFKDELKKLG
jgi:hypothetical protein